MFTQSKAQEKKKGKRKKRLKRKKPKTEKSKNGKKKRKDKQKMRTEKKKKENKKRITVGFTHMHRVKRKKNLDSSIHKTLHKQYISVNSKECI